MFVPLQKILLRSVTCRPCSLVTRCKEGDIVNILDRPQGLRATSACPCRSRGPRRAARCCAAPIRPTPHHIAFGRDDDLRPGLNSRSTLAHQFVRHQGIGPVALDAGLQAAGNVLGESVGGQRHDRSLLQTLHRPDASRGLHSPAPRFAQCCMSISNARLTYHAQLINRHARYRSSTKARFWPGPGFPLGRRKLTL